MITGTQFKSAVPTFVVSNVAETTRWYVKHLGFQILGHVPDTEPYVYASLQRDGAELMLLNLSGFRKPDISVLRPAGLWDAFIRTTGVHEFYRTLAEEPFINMPLKKQPYGDWEFEVRDPNGYILVFGGDANAGPEIAT